MGSEISYGAILHLAIDNLFAKIEAVLNRFIFGFVSVAATKFPILYLCPRVAHNEDVQGPVTEISQLVWNGSNFIALIAEALTKFT